MVTVRPETPCDFPAVYRLVREAFATAEVSDGTEQDFVERLRASRGYVPRLALLVKDAGFLTGYVMLTEMHLSAATPVLLLAPLCVRAGRRNEGIGSALVREAFFSARNMGCQAVILVGNPAYYSRFGFAQSTVFGVRNMDGIPDMYVQACELFPGALAGISAEVSFAGI